MTALQALLDKLIDYAGLFPPARLDMLTAVRNYAEYRVSEHAWALGRFIVPAQRLAEFTKAFNEVCCDEQGAPWLLSVLGSGVPLEDAQNISGFLEGAVFVDALECKVANADEAERTLADARSIVPVYVEFPLDQCEQVLPVLKQARARAKVRMGGVTPEAFPTAEELARFLVSCASAKVPFKATAGMHHPLRSVHKLTYEAESASTLMHGFINVFVAAVVAYYGAAQDTVLAILNEQDPSAFHWTRQVLSWRDKSFSVEQIRDARENFAIGFGSCSFTEPVDDLQALGWLFR